jgi:hypothetical protein
MIKKDTRVIYGITDGIKYIVISYYSDDIRDIVRYPHASV